MTTALTRHEVARTGFVLGPQDRPRLLALFDRAEAAEKAVAALREAQDGKSAAVDDLVYQRDQAQLELLVLSRAVEKIRRAGPGEFHRLQDIYAGLDEDEYRAVTAATTRAAAILAAIEGAK